MKKRHQKQIKAKEAYATETSIASLKEENLSYYKHKKNK